MSKHSQIFRLFIACPTDVVAEKKIVKELCEEYNDVQGDTYDVRLEVVDWEKNAYPLYGSPGQETINKQVLEKADFVIGLFWTKFGFPTGLASSATEEEILLTIKRQVPLMLYFSDKPKQPSLIDNAQYLKVLEFREKHKDQNLYWTYSTDEDFTKLFRRHLANFVKDILLPTRENPKPVPVVDKPEKEEDSTKAQYEQSKEIEKRIKKNFNLYWSQIFNIVDHNDNVLPNGIIINKQNKNKEEVKALKAKLEEWENRIIHYCDEFKSYFADVDKYSLDEFKYDIFGEKLWTVNGALKNPERELDRYRHAFDEAESYEIKGIVKNITHCVSLYEANIPPRISSNSIQTPDDFKFEILVHPPTLYKGVIGKGIRSEILHKFNPALFTLMTRKSIWGLYFLSDESNEFVFDDDYKGMFRTIHNYDYLYDRFSYYNWVIYKCLNEHLAKYKIKLNENLKYGYANLFLIEIEKKHKADIEKLKHPRKVNV